METQNELKKEVQINMPQMVLEGLSENWMLKELGDIHWTMICSLLNHQSHLLVDEDNNRLYPTFSRIRFSCSHSLREFQENEVLVFQNKLTRYRLSMFFSDCTISGNGKSIDASLMTTFTLRLSDNKNLSKGLPNIRGAKEVPENQSSAPFNSLFKDVKKVEEKKARPSFANTYSSIRKGEQSSIELGNEIFLISKESLAELDYDINPYQDINGVGLLYFASYPLIGDICERQFIHGHPSIYPVSKDWAVESSTLAKDVFYFGNCNLDDKITVQINLAERILPDKIKIIYSLHRRSDFQKIAMICVLKQLN